MTHAEPSQYLRRPSEGAPKYSAYRIDLDGSINQAPDNLVVSLVGSLAFLYGSIFDSYGVRSMCETFPPPRKVPVEVVDAIIIMNGHDS